jgi:hypothetical protein
MINIDKILETHNDKFRKTFNKKHGYLFDSQINTAKEIVANLARKTTRRNHVILAAKMQSGKTGVCNAVVNIISQTELQRYLAVDKYMFITGMNDCGLKSQTLKRVEEQVIGANKDNIYSGLRSKKNLSVNHFFVMKNSDLLKFEGDINNTVIFIDEAHYGSGEKNILTKFLYQQGIDWKDTNDLIKRNIYVISVSATPFDEIVSDTKEVKSIVELKPSKEYVGVSEYLYNGQVMDAEKDDIEEDGQIFEYINDAHQRMVDKGEAGVIIIRTRKFNIIEADPYIQKDFDIYEMYSSGSNIEYETFNEMVRDLIEKNEYNKKVSKMKSSSSVIGGMPKMYVKPLIVLIKGAFRAGITLDARLKDYVYMIYDFSLKADTTAQALLGRLCGYRGKKADISNTYIYVNKKFADMYSAWENDFQNRKIVPCSKTTFEWIPNNVKNPLAQIGTKSRGNIAIDLTDKEIREIYQFSAQLKNRVGYMKLALPEILKKHGVNLKYDYVGEAVLSGKNNYTKASQLKRFESFSVDSLVYQFRPYKIKDFVLETNRDYLTNDDLGKSAVFVVLDATIEDNGHKIGGNKRLLIYNVEVGQKIMIPNIKSLYKAYKDTDLKVV